MIRQLNKILLAGALTLLMGASLEVRAEEENKIPERIVTTNWDTPFYAGPSKQLDTGYVISEDTELPVISDIQSDDGMYYLINMNGIIGYVQYFACTKCIPEYKYIDSSTIATPSFVVLDGDIIDNSYNELIKYYEMVPEKIREQYQNEGFIVKMTGYPIVDEAYAPYGGYKGEGIVDACFDYVLKKLLVNDENPVNVIHEMGHYVNDKLNIMGRQKNKDLFNTEAARISRYAVSKPNEYFAECFDLYIRYPEALKIISPASYVMINEAIYEFESL